MSKSSSSKKNKKAKTPLVVTDMMPASIKKDHHIYIDCVVESANRGFFVCLSDSYQFLARADKLEKLYRIRMIPGDKVVVELDLRNLDPKAERQRGRIVWRYRKNKV